ncbi:family 43 glycosylhydrolase [Micromonospora sp. WMMD1102]|uniref:family 43 glycosylhydrolase n=1 Tax=Micromonospora sp. WMMD1102 TaxID=3016105 RepID=UPI00241527B6|nr:family 43 glycosylhydrolase [Micromonospora sp. WMMD1102]MDG4789124.1 family 43 glycosylhydrolase [Micromonospora sp. WMMD1102]
MRTKSGNWRTGQRHLVVRHEQLGDRAGHQPTLDPASPAYGWIDHGMVMRSRDTDSFHAIDPDVIVDADGQPWLAFGSFWNGLRIRRLDRGTGLPADGTLHQIASRGGASIENPSIVHRGGYYYLFASLDYCCRGVDAEYRTVVGRSASRQRLVPPGQPGQRRHGGGTGLRVRGCRRPDHRAADEYLPAVAAGVPRRRVRQPAEPVEQQGRRDRRLRERRRRRVALWGWLANDCQRFRLLPAVDGVPPQAVDGVPPQAVDGVPPQAVDGSSRVSVPAGIEAAGGWSRIENRLAGRVLEAAGCGGTGAPVQAYTWLDNACQRFRLESVGDVLIADATGQRVWGVPGCARWARDRRRGRAVRSSRTGPGPETASSGDSSRSGTGTSGSSTWARTGR